MAFLVRGVLDIAPRKSTLACLSMEEIISTEVIRQASKRITRVALMHIIPPPDPSENAPIRGAQVGKVMIGGLVEVMCQKIKSDYLANGLRKATFLDHCMNMTETLGAKVSASQLHAVQSRSDRAETLRHLNVAALVRCETDQLWPVSWYELMHDLIPNSLFVVTSGPGHLPTLEQPERTNEALQEWPIL